MRKIFWVFAFWIGLAAGIQAQSPSSAIEIEKKAARFHEALLKRPESDALFDRFFDAWLESDTIEQLEAFLTHVDRNTASDWFIAGRFYLLQNQDTKASNSFNKLINSSDAPQNTVLNAYVSLSDIASRKQDFSQALNYVKKAGKILAEETKPDPDRLKELTKREGELLLRTNKRKEGLTVWKKLMSSYPEDRFLTEDVITLLVEQGLFDEAIREQQLLIEKITAENDPYSAVLGKIQLGHIYKKANRNEDAIQAWQSTLEATGHDSWVEKEILGLIESQYRKNDNLTGLKTKLQELIEQQPKRLNLLVAEAQLVADMGQNQQAIDQWKHILSLTPGDKKLRLRFVKTLNELNLPQEAAIQIEILLKSHSDDNELRFSLAEYQHKADLHEKSAQSLLQFLENSDGSEFIYIRVGRKFAEFKQIAKAQQVYEDLVRKYPSSTNAKDAFALFLYDEASSQDRAIKIWKQIGNQGDVNAALLAAKQLSQRFEKEAPFEILQNRLDEFRDHYRFIGEYCLAGINNDQADKVLPLAIHQAQIASLPSELTSAIQLTIDVAEQISDNFSSAIKLTENSKLKNIKCLYASLLNESKRDYDAKRYLNNFLADLPNDQALLPLLTLKDLQKKQTAFRDATITLEKIITEIPGGRKTNHIQELIELYTKLNQTNTALKWVNEWKQINPESSRPWLTEAKMLELSGRNMSALRTLQNASRRFNEPEVLIHLAKMEIKSGYPSRAEKIYWDLYEASEDDWKRQQWIAEISKLAVKERRIDQVITEMQRRQRNNSKSIQPILALADVYRISNKTKEYREMLVTAYSIDPENISLVHRIADLDLREGKLDSARAQLKSVLNRDRSNRTSKRLISLYLATAEIDQTFDIIKRLPSDKRLSENEVLELANIYITVGEIDFAVKLLDLYKAKYPDNFDLHKTIAFAKTHSSTPEQGIDALLELTRFEVTPNQILANNNHNKAIPYGFNLHTIQSSTNYIKPRNSFYQTPQQHSRSDLVTDPISKWINQYLSINYHTLNNRQDRPVFASHPPYLILAAVNQQIQDKESLRAYIISSLLALPIDSNKIESKIAAAGIPMHEYHLAKYINTQNLSPGQSLQFDLEFVQNLYKRHPGLVDIAEWFLVQNAINNQKNQTADPALIDKAYAFIREHKGYEAAAIIALKNNRLNQAIVDFNQVESPTPELITQIIACLKKELTESDRENLKTKVHKWISDLYREPVTNQSHFVALLNYLSSDPDRWLDFVIAEYSRETKFKPLLDQNSHYNEVSHFRPKLSINSLPLMENRSPSLSLALRSAQSPNTVDYTKLESNPELGFSIAYFKQDNEAIQTFRKQIEQRISNVESTYNELLLLSSWEFLQADSAAKKIKAAQLLTELRLATPEKYEKISYQVDKLLFLIALSEPKSKELKEIGIAALLRLRVNPNISNSEWRWYGNHLKAWGKSEMMDRPINLVGGDSKSNRHLQRTIANAPINNFVSPSLFQFNAEYKKLIDKKKYDQAINLVSQQLPMHAGKLLATHRKNPNVFSYIERTIEKINRKNDVLQACDPGPNASLLEAARFAAVCEVLKKPYQAIERYQQILDQYPEHSVVHLRLINCLVDTDIEKAIDQLCSIAKRNGPKPSTIKILTSSLESITTKINQHSDRLELYRKLFPLFELLDESFYKDHQMVTSGPERILNYLRSSARINGKTIPAIAPKSYHSISGEDLKLKTQRDQLYIDFCKLFIKINSRQSGVYFSKLAQIYDYNNLPNDELVEYLNQINHKELILSNLSTGVSLRHHPLIWFIEVSKDRSKISDILASIEKVNPAQASTFKLVDQLYFGKSEHFNKVAKDIYNISSPISSVSRASRVQRWQLINRAAKARQIPIDQFNQRELSLAIMQDRKTGQWFDPSVYSSIATSLLDSKGSVEMVSYLQEINNRLNNETNATDQQYFKQLINNLLIDTKTWHPTMLYLRSIPLDQLKEQKLVIGATHIKISKYRTRIGDLPKLYTNTNLLADVDTIEVLPKKLFGVPEKSFDRHTFVGELFQNLRSMWDSNSMSEKNRRKQYNDAVETLEPANTFGTQIIKALGTTNITESILSVYHENLEKIQKQPETRQAELAMLAKDLINLNFLPRLLSPDEKRVIQWIGNTNDDSRYANFATAKSLTEFNSTISNGVISNSSFVFSPKDIIYDWKTYFLALENYIHLGEKAVQDRVLKPQKKSFAQTNLSRALDNNAPVESLAIVFSLFSSEKVSAIYHWQDLHKKIESHIKKSPTSQTVEIFANYLNAIDETIALDNIDTRVAALHFYRLFYSLNSANRQKISEWLETSEPNTFEPKLMQAVRYGLTIYSSREGLSPEQINILKDWFVSNRKNDLGIRLILAEKLTYNLKSMPHPIAELCAKALFEGIEQNEPVPQSTISRIVGSYIDASVKANREPNELDSQIINLFKKLYFEPSAYKDKPTRTIAVQPYTSSALATQLVKLSVFSQDTETANQLLNKFQRATTSSSAALFHFMVEQQNFDLATHLLKTRWEKILTQTSSYQYTKKTKISLKQYIQSIEHEKPWLKALARTTIETRPDTDDPENQSDKLYPDRVKDLAAQFDPSIFQNGFMEEAVLNRISNSHTNHLLLKYHANLDNNFSLSKILSIKDYRTRQVVLRNRFANVAMQLQAGSTVTYEKLLNELSNQKRINTYITQPIFEILTKSFSSQQTKEMAKKRIPFYLNALAKNPSNSSKLFPQFVASIYRAEIENEYAATLNSTSFPVKHIIKLQTAFQSTGWKSTINFLNSNELTRFGIALGVKDIKEPNNLSSNELKKMISEGYNLQIPKESYLNIQPEESSQLLK